MSYQTRRAPYVQSLIRKLWHTWLPRVSHRDGVDCAAYPATRRSRFARHQARASSPPAKHPRCFAMKPNFILTPARSRLRLFQYIVSILSLAHSPRKTLQFYRLGLHHAKSRTCMLRVSRRFSDPFAQDVLVKIKVACSLRQRTASSLTILTASGLNHYGISFW